MRRLIISFLVVVCSFAARAATTNNDDSCDIGPYPAATLLLPYFEVETQNRGVDTFFTVTNVSIQPQIAHVTVWTDYSFPVLSFNIFLTGYDVQSISMYDVLVNGIIAPTNANLTAGGTSSDTIPGSESVRNDRNPNLSIANCSNLPGFIPGPTRQAVISALSTGIYNAIGFPQSCGTTFVGSAAVRHRTATTAVGYVTIDVTSKCTPTLGSDPSYFANEILFDNVLTGDSITVDKNVGANFAGGNPLVHIRAVPEGGPAGSMPPAGSPATTLPYTFYGRFVNGQKIGDVELTPHFDRRQPLPSTFAARFIQGGPNAFATDFKIWREGRTGPVTCTTPPSSNSALAVPEIVRFDEHENPMIFRNDIIICTPVPTSISLPATSLTRTGEGTYPPMNSPAGDTSGWLYLNLNSGTTNATINRQSHPDFPATRPSQNWVTVTMTAGGSSAGLFGVEFDATPLGNGCSPAAARSAADGGQTAIGPAGGALVCPSGYTLGTSSACTPAYTGSNTNP